MKETTFEQRFKQIYTDASSEVADEFYPKGDKRRGAYLRDQAVLYSKLMPQLRKLYAQSQGNTTAPDTTMALDTIVSDMDIGMPDDAGRTGRSLESLEEAVAASWWIIDDLQLAKEYVHALSLVQSKVSVSHQPSSCAILTFGKDESDAGNAAFLMNDTCSELTGHKHVVAVADVMAEV